MIRRTAFAAAMVVIMAAALSLRLSSLGNRPFHGDEAVHAFKFRELWEHGSYRYDPNEFHGPTIYYAALPTVALSGHHRFGDTTETDYRLAVALFGAALVLLLLLLCDAVGKNAVLWAALFTALSPAFVFYSRYYIQEILLVFFTLTFLGSAWRFRQSERVAWLIAAATSAGLMIATKETAVLTFVAAVAAWFVTLRRRASVTHPPAPSRDGRWVGRLTFRDALLAAAIALGVAYVLLSGFLTNPAGPLSYFQAYTSWLRRAGGTNLHNQSWTYYLSFLAWHHPSAGPIWSEALILGLALLATVAAFVKGDSLPGGADRGFMRFLAVYTLLLTAVYSAIPYKTPWCVLSFLSGMILLAGVGTAVIFDSFKNLPVRVLLAGLILAGSAQLGWQAYRTSFIFQTDIRNPYVYAQPVPDVVEIKKRAEELAEVHPKKFAMVVKVISADEYYWPLPWYLRRFDNVGYWTKIPEDPDAALVFVSPEFDEDVTKRLDKTHIMTGFYGLRPSVVFETFVRMDLWEPFITLKNKRKAASGASGEE